MAVLPGLVPVDELDRGLSPAHPLGEVVSATVPEHGRLDAHRQRGHTTTPPRLRRRRLQMLRRRPVHTPSSPHATRSDTPPPRRPAHDRQRPAPGEPNSAARTETPPDAPRAGVSHRVPFPPRHAPARYPRHSPLGPDFGQDSPRRDDRLVRAQRCAAAEEEGSRLAAQVAATANSGFPTRGGRVTHSVDGCRSRPHVRGRYRHAANGKAQSARIHSQSNVPPTGRPAARARGPDRTGRDGVQCRHAAAPRRPCRAERPPHSAVSGIMQVIVDQPHIKQIR